MAEDPAKNFQPDTGKIEVYRSAGGNGVRLDGGNGKQKFVLFIPSLAVSGVIVLPSSESALDPAPESPRRKLIADIVQQALRALLSRLFTIRCWSSVRATVPRMRSPGGRSYEP